MDHLLAQSNSPVFRHFTTEDGLPSSEVYYALQDSKGFMWFATDHGVSRFNGYEFRTFTTKDGLADNTSFKLFEDTRGRIWMLTFSGKIFYFEDNRIIPYRYNHLLNTANENVIPLGIFVDRNEDVYISFLTKGMLKIDSSGTCTWKLLNFGFEPQNYLIDEFADGRILASLTYNDNLKKEHPAIAIHSLNSKTDTVYFSGITTGKFNALRWSDSQMIYAFSKTLYEINGASHAFLCTLPADITFLLKEKQRNRLWVGTSTGVYCFENENFAKWTQHDLIKKNISSIACDNEGGYWFTTLEDGVWYLPGDAIHNFSFTEDFLQAPLCLAAGSNKVAYAAYRGALLELRGTTWNILYHTSGSNLNFFSVNHLYADTGRQRVYFSQSLSGYYSAGDFHPFKNKLRRGLQTNFCMFNGTLYCGGSSFIFREQGDSLAVEKIIGQRVNCLSPMGSHNLLIGCNSGVLEYDIEKKETRIFHNDFNNTRVDDIEWFNNIACFATRGKGVVFLIDGKTRAIDESKGLSSDLVSKLFVDGNDLWCATNKGISKIHFKDFKKFDYTISTIHSSDGLLSDEINDILVLHDTVYVATKSGISCFNKNADFINHTAPKVHITSVRVNNTDTPVNGSVDLLHDQNTIRISFTGISFRSDKNISYHYLLSNGQDTVSEYTSNRDVEFLSLPPSHYTFTIAAVNNSGIASMPASFAFYIRPAWWQTWWFRILVALAIASIIFYIYRFQVKKLREKFVVERRQASLHLTALRAQMNPHFIFNVMSSIRNYMQNNDSASAEKYLTSFAKHLRSTLDNSEEQEVSLEEELKALKTYAELEMQGFENGFEFIVKCCHEIDMKETMLPSLLLQPFVENAIKHGIRGTKGTGKIIIDIKKINDCILIAVEDNGVGREESSNLNRQQNGHHRSHGTSITFDRISAFNKAYNKNIVASVTDLTDTNGKPAGTRVEIRV